MTPNLPDPSPVLDLIEAFRRSKTMFTALSLGVFDALHAAPTSANAASFARESRVYKLRGPIASSH